MCERRAVRGVDELLHVSGHLVAFSVEHGAARQHPLHGFAELGALDLQVCDLLGSFAITGLPFLALRGADRLVEQLRDLCQTLVGLGEGSVILVERIAQDAAADRLQLGRDLADADGVLRLQAQQIDLVADGRKLRYGEGGKACAKHQEDGEAAIEPTANPKIQERHGAILAVVAGRTSRDEETQAARATGCRSDALSRIRSGKLNFPSKPKFGGP